jgi:hypothetical protein
MLCDILYKLHFAWRCIISSNDYSATSLCVQTDNMYDDLTLCNETICQRSRPLYIATWQFWSYTRVCCFLCVYMQQAKLSNDIGVINSLVSTNLDVDAMHRLTVPQPVTFRHSDGNKVLQLPYRTLVPYNEQSTLHFRSALFALLLPTTVDSR